MTLIASVPKVCWNLQIVSTWVSIGASSVLSSWAKRKCDNHVLHLFAIWQWQAHPAVLLGSNKYVHESPF
jgi:hypothetical protein